MKSEREKQILHNITYMQNLEKWYRWIYLQSRNRDTGTSLVVQWLRLRAPNAGGLASIPSQETRSHKNTGMGCLSLHQGIFPTQGSNPGLPHCGQILYQLSRKGSPRILEWVAYPFSRVSSQLWNWTGASCIAGKFFNNWAIREAPNFHLPSVLDPRKTKC